MLSESSQSLSNSRFIAGILDRCPIKHTVQLASSRLPGGIDINLDLNFITPSAFKLHFRPCFFDINLEYELAHFADADCVNWQDFALNRDHQAIFERYLWECANVES